MTTKAKSAHHVHTQLAPVPITRKSAQEVVNEIDMSNLSQKEKQPFIEVVNAHLDTFQSNFLGYNNTFGKVNANFEWAGKTRPVPMKLQALAYGSHRAMLYNLKCQQLKDKGVLVSPADLNMQPIITNNRWITKNLLRPVNPSNNAWSIMSTWSWALTPSTNTYRTPWKSNHSCIYTNLAKWEVMAKLYFSNFYHQIKFKNNTHINRKKLGYLCVHTAYGTLAYTHKLPWASSEWMCSRTNLPITYLVIS